MKYTPYLISLILVLGLFSCKAKKAIVHTSTQELIAEGKIQEADELVRLPRKLVHRDLTKIYRKMDFEDVGEITFFACINPEGRVISLELIEDRTTMSGDKNKRVYHDAIQKYGWEADKRAPSEECGTIMFMIKNNGKKKDAFESLRKKSIPNYK